MSVRDPDKVFAFRSIEYRIAMGWVVVIALLWRFVIHPLLVFAAAANGWPTPPALDPWSVGDSTALLGMPLAGSVAEKVARNA